MAQCSMWAGRRDSCYISSEQFTGAIEQVLDHTDTKDGFFPKHPVKNKHPRPEHQHQHPYILIMPSQPKALPSKSSTTPLRHQDSDKPMHSAVKGHRRGDSDGTNKRDGYRTPEPTGPPATQHNLAPGKRAQDVHGCGGQFKKS